MKSKEDRLKIFSRWLLGLILVCAVSLATPLLVLADGCNNIGELLPQCACSGYCQLSDFLALAANLAQWGVGILAGIVVGLLIYGGFGMMTAFGSAEKIEANKKLLGGTFRGMAIVLLGWVIVSTIISFLTGRGDGLLYQGADKTTGPWWEFEETSNCPPRWDDVTKKEVPQHCINATAEGNDDWYTNKNCQSLGICPGDKNFVCCDY